MLSNIHTHLALILSLTAAACTIQQTSSGTNGSSGGGGPSSPSTSGGPQSPGSADADIVGIWQQTVASAGDYTNATTGETFSQTSGYSSMLKARADGTYVFEHFSKGTSSACSLVSYLDHSTGTFERSEGRLVLHPTERTLDVQNCSESGKRTLSNDPIELTAQISPYENLAKEQTFALDLAGPFQLKLKLLQRDPMKVTVDPTPPAGFMQGTDGPFAELVGTWTPSADSDITFYDPATGSFHIPVYNAAEHKWLRFSEGSYEMASAIERVNEEGVCKKDVIYYESGSALFNTLSKVNDTYQGDVRFEARVARLIVRIRDCGEDDGDKTYEVAAPVSYYKWGFTASVGFQLGCEYARNAWQFATCTNSAGWNSYHTR